VQSPPDPRSAKRQRYCSKAACRQASKAASQHHWLQKPGNRDYFTGPTHVERVRQWRRAHPGYWRPQARGPQALQEDLTPQETQKQPLDDGLTPHALQDVFFMQPAVVVGLIAHLTGLTLQDDIATTARRLQQLGRDILCGSPHHQGGIQDGQTPHFAGQTPGLIVGWACATANVADNTFQWLVRQFEDRMIVLSDMAFHATEGDPTNLKLCQRGAWEDRMLVETVLAMLTLVCHLKKVMHRGWAYFQARLAFTMAAFNVLVQWHGFQPNASGFVPLSIAEFSL